MCLQSSLLMSILGELPVSSGDVQVKGSMAYVSQVPWVFSASVRQNITFGQPFDMAKYQMIIKAAALTKVTLQLQSVNPTEVSLFLSVLCHFATTSFKE